MIYDHLRPLPAKVILYVVFTSSESTVAAGTPYVMIKFVLMTTYVVRGTYDVTVLPLEDPATVATTWRSKQMNDHVIGWKRSPNATKIFQKY